jgi:hypothetical protein
MTKKVERVKTRSLRKALNTRLMYVIEDLWKNINRSSETNKHGIVSATEAVILQFHISAHLGFEE